VRSVASRPAAGWGRVLGQWRRPSRRELGQDLALAAVLAAVTMLEALVVDGTEQDGPPGLALTLVLAAAVAAVVVAARRSWPILALVGVSVLGSWLGIGYGLLALTSYGVGYRVREAGRAAAAVAFAAVVPTAVGWYLVLREQGPEYDLGLILAVVTSGMTVAALVGRYWRQRTALVAAGWERAARLEHERALTADRARLRERSRIAQDMHDSLGHELSLIALQAGALELDEELPERHRATARLLRATTADAVTTLRDIVGVLRDDAEPAPTEPAGEDVAGLVERAAAAGVEIRLEQQGAPAPLPPLVDRALYRVVQESVTNATNHAPGAPVLVRLRHDADEVVVEVRNGPPPEPPPEPGRGGHGLLGLAERVRLAGGQLTAGRQGDSFQVLARLPRRGGVPGPGDPAAAPGEPAPEAVPRFTPAPDELAEVDGYGSMMARLRRRFWLRLAVPAALLAILVGGYLVAFGLQQATLPAHQFETVRVGETRTAVEARLPGGTPDKPADFGPVPAPPAGASCRYYVPRASSWFDLDGFDPNRVFRLCYRDGRLVAREVLRKAGP
jgi:signal transduction histidine kinase